MNEPKLASVESPQELSLFIKIDPANVKGTVQAEEPCAAPVSFAGKCSIGAYTYVGPRSGVRSAAIGRYCSIATDVTISPPDHPSDWFSSHPFVFDNKVQFAAFPHFLEIAKPQPFASNQLMTVIGNDVWIGRGAIIKRGVTIGDGAIIGAGSLVVKDVAPYEIVGGIPAKHIRFRFDHEIIVRFQKLQWWNYDLSHKDLVGIDYSDVSACLDKIESLVANGALKLLSPRTRIISKKPPATLQAVADQTTAPMASRQADAPAS